MKALLSLLAVLCICNIACSKPYTFIKHNDERIKITGRTGLKDSLTELYWSGSSIKVNFTGNGIAATFSDQRGDNYYNILIDGKLTQVLKLETAKTSYILAQGLKDTVHHLEIFKRTEWDRGITSFYGFGLLPDTKLLQADPPAALKIEYFGNSITAGYAVDDTAGKDRPEGVFTNHYDTYAALTARHFKADHHCTCKSGIGIMISWFPLTMPQIYDRTNPEDSLSKWNFQKFSPDIVVVNLLQNDSWLVLKKDYPTFVSTFGKMAPSEAAIINAYQNFIKSIRAKYPKAHIICMLGNMDITQKGSKWPGYVTKATQPLQDAKLHTLFFPYKGTPGHPSKQENKTIADLLINYIETHIAQ